MVTIKVQVLNVFLQPGPPYRVDDREWAVLPRGNRITNSDLIKKNRLLHVASFATYAPVLKFLCCGRASPSSLRISLLCWPSRGAGVSWTPATVAMAPWGNIIRP